MDKFSFYLDEIRKFPILEAKQEAELARRWHDDQDPEALRLLAGSHVRLVVKIAAGFRGYGMPWEDLVAAGNLGLMQGISKFDPDRGCRLSTYASWWIRAAIQEYVLRNWSLVRATRTASRKKLFFNLRRIKAQIDEIDDSDLAPENVHRIARELDVPERDVVEMNEYLSSKDVSLNASREHLSGGAGIEWIDALPDDAADQEERTLETDELHKRRALMENALKHLNDRERHILTERKLKDEPVTLEVLSQQYGISRERVRQIEARAFEKLEKAIMRAAKICGLADRCSTAS